LDTERTTLAGGAEAEHYRRGSISSATEADEKTSRKCFGKQSGKPQDGKQADANMCRFLSCFPRRNVTKW
jgi:hypothetical protein